VGSQPESRIARALGFDPEDVVGAGEPEDERELAALAEALQEAARVQEAAWPEPAPAETDRLVADLAALVPVPESSLAAELERALALHSGWLARALAAIRPQVRMLERPFWLASAALVAAGLPLLSGGVSSHLGLDLTYGAFLLLVAPVLSAMGVAYAFRGAGAGIAELELTCALTPAQLVLGRLFWVTAYDALLLGGASLLSAAAEPSVRLGWLVLGWLLPLLLLSLTVLALSLYVPPWVGGSAALALWALVMSLLVLGRDLPLAAVTHPVVLLPMSALCAGGILVSVCLIAGAWPRLGTRMAGLGAREVQ